MSGKLLLLCPGQGGQHSAMFELARSHPRANALIDACGAADLLRQDLFCNRVAQPAVVAASLAMWTALKEDVPAPDLVAGYSVGELAAYCVAGAISAADALALAAVRAGLMDAAAAGAPQALVAIGGLPMAQLQLLAQAQGWHVAIVTGDDTCISGGLQSGVDALGHAVVAAGGRAERLPIAIASHTPLMARAAAPFADAIDAVAFSSQHCPVLAGISGAKLIGKAQASHYLSRQLCETIHWSDCMDAAQEAGVSVALELGPGAALSRMLHTRHPGIACRSISDFRSLAAIKSWLIAQLGAD